MSNLNLLTIPDEKSRFAPFPPSCRVLAHLPDKSGPIISGTIGRIFVDLFSSSRENQYVIIPDSNPNASKESSEQELVATAPCLCYGPGCPVYLKSSTASILSSVPGMSGLISSSAGGNKMEATVMSAYRTTFQAEADGTVNNGTQWLYSLEVTTRDDKKVIRHGISQDLVSYRHVDEKAEKKKTVEFATQAKQDEISVSSAVSASASASISASPSKLPSITAGSSFDRDDDECSSITTSVSGRPDLKRASSADASLSLSSYAQTRTTKRMKSGETSHDSSSTTTVHIRRIDIPTYVAIGYLKMKLIGNRGVKCKQLESKLKIKYYLIHRQLKASHQFLDRSDRYGDIAPIRGPNCILIRATTREAAQHAVKVIVHILSNEFRGKKGTSGEILREELLGSVQEATVEDPSFGKAISRLNADDFASAPLSYSSSVSEDDDGSSSNNVIDPNYTFSTDSFTNSDDEEETWGRRKKHNKTNRRRHIHRTQSHFERRGSRSVRSFGVHPTRRSRSSYEPTWSRSPVKRSRPNIVTPAKRPAPTIDSALSSKR